MDKHDDLSHEWIAEQVKSGQYYKDAREWFDLKYQSMGTHKAYFILMTVIACCTGLCTAIGFLGILPITQPVEMLRYADDVYGEHAQMIPLAERYANTDPALIKYHVVRYIRARERYVVRDLEVDVARVRALSSEAEYKAYRRFIHPSNAKGPIARFQRNASRIVDITQIEYLYEGISEEARKDGALANGVVATVDATVITRSEKKSDGKYRIKMKFDYVPVKVDQETEEVTQMEFTVTHYDVEKL